MVDAAVGESRQVLPVELVSRWYRHDSVRPPGVMTGEQRGGKLGAQQRCGMSGGHRGIREGVGVGVGLWGINEGPAGGGVSL